MSNINQNEKKLTEPVVVVLRSDCWGAMTDTIFFEIDFLHLGIENEDDEEEKAERPRSFCNKEKD